MDTVFEVPHIGWRDDDRRLWGRIAVHPPGGAQFDGFLRRIVREQRWPLAFAHQAITEYKKFCFLTVISPTPVTPGEEVDEVWHLHLLYSRDYWDVWCPVVLGAVLHHDPADAMAESQQVCREQYAATLALYESFFGPPPVAFWPATHRRFGRGRRMADLWWGLRPPAWLGRWRGGTA